MLHSQLFFVWQLSPASYVTVLLGFHSLLSGRLNMFKLFKRTKRFCLVVCENSFDLLVR